MAFVIPVRILILMFIKDMMLMKHVTRLVVANIILLFNMAVSAQDLNPNLAQANLAPDCSTAAPSQSVLWPPNHKFSVIDILGISDPNGDLISTVVQCIRQDEPLNSTGDGNTEYDASGVGSASASVRRERKGNSNGRVYHINYIATDSNGARCGGHVKVAVPKNKKRIAVDEGPVYDSVSNNGDCATDNINNPPIAFDQSVSLDEDTSLAITLTASDPDRDTMTLSLEEHPVHGTLTGVTPDLVYTPAADFYGEDSFTFKTNDGQIDSSIATVSITVLPVNDAPIADNQTLEVEAGEPLAITLTGSDIDSDNLSFKVTSTLSAGTITGSTPNIVYTSAVDFEGEVNLTFIANDGELDSQPAVIKITVIQTNEPPTIVTPPVTQVVERANYTYDVDATDPNDDPLTYSVSIAPQGLDIATETGLINWLAPSSYAQPVPTFNNQCYIVPDDIERVGSGDAESAFRLPLFQRVRNAISQGSDYTAPQTEAWHRRNRCLGCHVHTQALLHCH
jgi:hypothetical protein